VGEPPRPPWTGAVLCSVQMEPTFVERLVISNVVPAPIRRLDDYTVEYSEPPITIRAKLIPGDDPWVQGVDPTIYRNWTEALGCQPASLVVLSAQSFAHLDEYLLMHVGWLVEFRYPDAKVAAWDFNISDFAPITDIEWTHVVDVVMGRAKPEWPYEAARRRPQVPEGYDDLYPKKRKGFWRRGLSPPVVAAARECQADHDEVYADLTV